MYVRTTSSSFSSLWLQLMRNFSVSYEVQSVPVVEINLADPDPPPLEVSVSNFGSYYRLLLPADFGRRSLNITLNVLTPNFTVGIDHSADLESKCLSKAPTCVVRGGGAPCRRTIEGAPSKALHSFFLGAIGEDAPVD